MSTKISFVPKTECDDYYLVMKQSKDYKAMIINRKKSTVRMKDKINSHKKEMILKREESTVKILDQLIFSKKLGKYIPKSFLI